MKILETANVKIPALLKAEIEYYISKNKKFEDFEDFLIFYIKQGLENEILGTMSKLDRSYRCRDFNPKTARRVYDDSSGKSEFFLCEKHRSDPIFDRYALEENITWGDWKQAKKSRN